MNIHSHARSQKFGEHNIKELLSRTKVVNPKFYTALMEQLRPEGITEEVIL